MNDTPRAIRLGVIGTGLALEQLHWPALRQMPDRYTIAAFANHSRPKAAHFASYTGASMNDYSADYHHLLKRDDVDAVLIALPIALLYPVTRDALVAGKDVICEKPAGGNEEEGRAFLALADAYPDRTVMIAENCFYRDDLRLARSLLDTNAIGRVHALTWRMVNRNVPIPGQFSSTPWRHHPAYRGGAHLDGGVHHIALIRLLCGDVRQVHANVQRANATIDAPSDLTLNLRFVSGAIGNYTAIYPDIAIPPEPNETRLYGTEGVMVLGGQSGTRYVTVYRADGTSETHRIEGLDNGFYNEWCDFYDAVVHGEPLIGTVARSVQNMLIVLGGLDAAELGQVIALDASPVPLSEPAIPLWRPRGASGLFDGLPIQYTVERA